MNGEDVMFEMYLIKKISASLKQKRKDRKLTQKELAIKMTKIGGVGYNEDVLRRTISSIENEKFFQTNASFLTDQLLLGYSRVFDMEKEEIVFGSEDDIESYCRYIFKSCGYNFYSENNINNLSREKNNWLPQVTSDKNLAKLNEKIIELMYFDSSFVFAHKTIAFPNYNTIDYLKEDYEFYVNYAIAYNKAFDRAWSLFKSLFIKSFKTKFINSDIYMLHLNNRIYKWLNEEVVTLIDDFINNYLKNDEVYRIGYEVYSIELEKFNSLNYLKNNPPNNKTFNQYNGLISQYVELYEKSYGTITLELSHMQEALFALLKKSEK